MPSSPSMTIVGYCISTRRSLKAFVRGTVTDRFNRNRHVLLLKVDVAVSFMNDLDATARYLQELLPDVVGELEHWPVPRRAPGPDS